tara:strand:- start:200 stop:877 length:678 start_codon:yes stop_codon:yes gene_type:complete
MPADEESYFLTRKSAKSIDNASIQEFGCTGVELMERAAEGAVGVALEMSRPESNVLILAGPGNNGGDGWAMARLLADEGRRVEICSLAPPAKKSDAALNADRAKAMELEIYEDLSIALSASPDLIIDALFGTGLDRPIEGRAGKWIERINELDRNVLSIDLPSGLDADTGSSMGHAIEATRTATFIALKKGMKHSHALKLCGKIDVIDIGTPKELLHIYGQTARG